MEFTIQLHSMQDIQDLVDIATLRPFEVIVSNCQVRVRGRNFMSLFSLDINQPLTISADCSPEEFDRLKQDAARFIVSKPN